jgi:hypothetical protein
VNIRGSLAWESLGEGRWRALVTYAVDEGGAVTLVQQWVPAELVRPLR